MSLCGYHLRCLNSGDKCSDCTYQQKDTDKDYLNDVLNRWPKGKEAEYVAREEESDRF